MQCDNLKFFWEIILSIISKIFGKVWIIYLLKIVYSASLILENNFPDIIWVKIFEIISKFSLAVIDKTPLFNIPLKYGFEIKGIIILPIKKFDKKIKVWYSEIFSFFFEYFSFIVWYRILFIDFTV